MECLICPLKESMICSIFPCAISVLFTDEDKNQEGFVCQKHKFKAGRENQSPKSQLGLTCWNILVTDLLHVVFSSASVVLPVLTEAMVSITQRIKEQPTSKSKSVFGKGAYPGAEQNYARLRKSSVNLVSLYTSVMTVQYENTSYYAPHNTVQHPDHQRSELKLIPVAIADNI